MTIDFIGNQSDRDTRVRELARPKLFTWQRCAAQTLAVYKMALAAR